MEAEKWPEWYEGCSDVNILNTEESTLQAASIFSWKTMGINFESEIKEFAPPYRLSWESWKRRIKGYHAWLVVPTENGCKVITEESQYGWLSRFEKWFIPNKLERMHDIWLAELKRLAETQDSISQSN